VLHFESSITHAVINYGSYFNARKTVEVSVDGTEYRTRSVASDSEHPYRCVHRAGYLLLSAALAIGAVMVSTPFLRANSWNEQPLLTSLVGIVLGLVLVNALAKWLLLPKMRKPLDQPAPADLRIAAVTTYVPGSEPLEMVACTLRAMQRMDYPHDCWLLDEGDDPHARQLCATLGVSYFTRAGRPEYQTTEGTFKSRSKHGNYNAWLAEGAYDRYDVVVSFDLDHVPAREFLTATIGHLSDPRVGYVQTPQAYYNQHASFIAAGAAEETYDFHSTIQMASYAMGYPIVVGCHNVHRVSALREVGGYAAHTADDVLITMLYRRHGWRGVYVPRILARGLTPVDWDSYLVQQRRWTRSLCDLKFRHQARLAAGMPFASRCMSYLHGIFYLQPLVMFAAAGVLLLATLARGAPPIVTQRVEPHAWLVLGAALLACYLFRQQFFLDPRTEFGLHWRARVLRIAKAPALLLGVLDALSSRRFGYMITKKSGAAAGTSRGTKQMAKTFALAAIVLMLAWLWGYRTLPDYPTMMHVLGAVTVSGCVMLAATEWLPVPSAFDQLLLRRYWAPWLS
jgi:cellulose synthase (UDP-forming)